MNSHNIYLRYLEIKDAQSLLFLRLRNRSFYQAFEPIRDELHYTLEGQEKEIVTRINSMTNDEAYTFGIFLKETEELVGRISLTGVTRGPLQHANIGYYVDQKYNNKGYATEAIILCLEIAFNELKLHRIHAGVMPKNSPSIRVLEKAGFQKEGLAKSYLKVNGSWEDHILYAIIAN